MKPLELNRVVPPWYHVALNEVGTDELLEGGKPNPRIQEYFKSTTFKQGDAHDAWCSAFACYCVEQALINDPALMQHVTSPRSAHARDWLKWGISIDEPKFGCIVVYRRPPAGSMNGHVHFYEAGPVNGKIWGLGGNQHNKVCIAAYDQSDVLGYRWPAID